MDRLFENEWCALCKWRLYDDALCQNCKGIWMRGEYMYGRTPSLFVKGSAEEPKRKECVE